MSVCGLKLLDVLKRDRADARSPASHLFGTLAPRGLVYGGAPQPSKIARSVGGGTKLHAEKTGQRRQFRTGK